MNGEVQERANEEAADRVEFRRAILAGLARRPRGIPAKFLYDSRGSALFDQICDLPEYYLTRTETGILRRHAADIARRAGPGRALIECGSGSSVKSRLLLDALVGLVSYSPIDISRRHLDETAARLRRDYPALAIEPLCGDYMEIASLPPIAGTAPRLGFFPGSTIGNLEPHEARTFLRGARRLLGDGAALVLGVDLQKDHKRLHDAYNDAAGVTAEFSLNLLHRMNRELAATFDVGAFVHDAFYNPQEGRIEIYIRSLRVQSVSVAGRTFDFAEGERIHSEYSYKYDFDGIHELAVSGGFGVAETWLDDAEDFAVVFMTVA